MKGLCRTSRASPSRTPSSVGWSNGEAHQLVVMALPAGEEIGAEVHELDQFFRVEEGDR